MNKERFVCENILHKLYLKNEEKVCAWYELKLNSSYYLQMHLLTQIKLQILLKKKTEMEGICHFLLSTSVPNAYHLCFAWKEISLQIFSHEDELMENVVKCTNDFRSAWRLGRSKK